MGVLTDSFAKCSWAKSFDIQGLNEELDKIESSLCGWKEMPPRSENILDALVELKVFPEIVIVGTEPYKDDGQATGVPFSVPDNYNENPPKTLKTLNRCFGFEKGLRSEWVKWMNERHVLLLNCALTYSKGHRAKHRNLWSGFIKQIIAEIIRYCRKVGDDDCCETAEVSVGRASSPCAGNARQLFLSAGRGRPAHIVIGQSIPKLATLPIINKAPNTCFWLLRAWAKSLRDYILGSEFRVSEKQVFSSCHPSYVRCVGRDNCPCYRCFATNWRKIVQATHNQV